jgi:hypothetical protein
MSNYFSQLIHQTTLSVASPSRVSAGTRFTSDRGQEPLQVVDAEVTATQPNPSTEPMQTVRDKSPDSLIPPEDSHTSFEIDSEQETRSQPISSQKENKTTLENTSLKTYSDLPVQKEPLIQEIEETQSLDRFKPDENHPTHLLEPSQTSDRRKKAEKTLEQDEGTINAQPSNHPPVPATNLTDLRQAYLQAARDWVAEAPVSIEKSREVLVHDRPPPEVSAGNLEPSQSAFRPQPIPLEQRDPSEPQRPAVQDLVLSIGSINVTIEAPQADLPTPSVLPVNPEPRSAPDLQPSRISRYYLR